jgi:hypothetical protein
MWSNNKLYIKEETVVSEFFCKGNLNQCCSSLMFMFTVHHIVPVKRETDKYIFISLWRENASRTWTPRWSVFFCMIVTEVLLCVWQIWKKVAGSFSFQSRYKHNEWAQLLAFALWPLVVQSKWQAVLLWSEVHYIFLLNSQKWFSLCSKYCPHTIYMSKNNSYTVWIIVKVTY